MTGAGLVELSQQECFELLRAHHLGRIGVLSDETPTILPVNYTMYRDDVVFFTDPGTKLSAAVLKRRVAFEIDSATPFAPDGWSVVVVGRCEELREARVVREVEELGLHPRAAAGVRDRIVRIRAEQVTGRGIDDVAYMSSDY